MTYCIVVLFPFFHFSFTFEEIAFDEIINKNNLGKRK
jgi:hypothetical protein